MTIRRALPALLAILILAAARPPGRAVAAADGKPLTDAEVRAVAEEFVRAIDARDLPAVNKVIDWGAIFRRAMAGVEAPERFKAGFLGGIEKSMASEQGLAGSLVAAVASGAQYVVIHRHAGADRPRLVLRLLLPNGSVNYHEMFLARTPDGPARIDDIYIYMNGERISETFHKLYIQAAAGASAGLLGRLTGADQKTLKFLEKLGAGNKALQAGDHARALALYNELPDDQKGEKNALMLRLRATQGLGEDQYARSIEEFRRLYPEDACINMMSIDHFVLQKKPREAIACIDRVDRAVGGDAHLRTLRGSIEVDMGDLTAARADIQQALDLEPNLIGARSALATITLKEKNHGETLRLLRSLRDESHVEFGDLAGIPLYADFVKSPEYREWLKDRPAPADPKAQPDEGDGR